MPVFKWSKTAATNSGADATINWAEGMAPSAVNDSARAEMAAVAKWRDDISGTLTTTGSSTAYALTTNSVFDTAANMSGAMITFIPHATSGASPTLAVDGLTARAINKSTGVAVATGQLIVGTPYVVSYIHATTEFILQGYTETFGNVTVNGTTLLTGVATFTAAPVFNGGGALGTGTYTGAATFSGNLVLSGTPNYTNITKAMGIAGSTTANRSGSPTAGDTRYNTTLNGLEYWNGTAWIVLGQAPTVQKFTSGTAQTYTAAAGVVRQRVRMVGGGGGGGATITNVGSNGTSSSFQVNGSGTAWTAVLGQGGGVGTSTGSSGGLGGTGGVDGSTGTLVARFSGQSGNTGLASTGTNADGGAGGNSVFGGAGAGGGGVANAKANTGSGGAGGGAVSANCGGGGGAGEYVEFWVTGMTTATYTVGALGNGGAAGTNAGRNGAAGIIIIEEFYS